MRICSLCFDGAPPPPVYKKLATGLSALSLNIISVFSLYAVPCVSNEAVSANAATTVTSTRSVVSRNFFIENNYEMIGLVVCR